jgi:hypothetical protein
MTFKTITAQFAPFPKYYVDKIMDVETGEAWTDEKRVKILVEETTVKPRYSATLI